MEKIVVYCHGFGSSPKTDKVARLAASGYETFAFPIDIDPDVSLPALARNVLDLLLDQKRMNAQLELVFVGTSLGGWYANRLGEMFGAKHICVNPAYNPAQTLGKLGVDDEIASKYEPIAVNELTSVFIAEDDEVIDLMGGIKSGEFDIEHAARVVFTKGGHRYNGVEFEAVVDLLKVI